MKTKQIVALSLVSFLCVLLSALPQTAPGYMDADYYFIGAQRLAEGHGFTEQVLWQYLDDPLALPHPSHLYWMPLVSIIAAAGIHFFPSVLAFRAAQLLMGFLAFLVPLLTAALSFKLFKKANTAFLAGLLACFSAFYLPYIANTDSFALLMLLGGLFFLTLIDLKRPWQFAAIGLLAGLMHLTRAEGLLWLLLALLLVVFRTTPKQYLPFGLLVLLGYSAIMGPWMLRNWQTSGSLFAPGVSRALFITHYDETFSFPAAKLTISHWLQMGWSEIINHRWQALLGNFQTAALVHGVIVLGPLALVSAVKNRSWFVVRTASAGYLFLFVGMSVLFPFASVRGGFFHAGAAFMPLIWAIAADGFEHSLLWASSKRAWVLAEARGVLTTGLLCIVFFMSAFLINKKANTWDDLSDRYRAVEQEILRSGAGTGQGVMLINPPSYYAANQRPAIAIPNEGVDTLLEVAKFYGASYLILELDHPQALAKLYAEPASLEGLLYLGSLQSPDRDARIHLFRIEE